MNFGGLGSGLAAMYPGMMEGRQNIARTEGMEADSAHKIADMIGMAARGRALAMLMGTGPGGGMAGGPNAGSEPMAPPPGQASQPMAPPGGGQFGGGGMPGGAGAMQPPPSMAGAGMPGMPQGMPMAPPPMPNAPAPMPGQASMPQGGGMPGIGGPPGSGPPGMGGGMSGIGGPLPGMPGSAGRLDWKQIVQALKQQNPGMPPQALAAAVDQFMPMMTQQSQQDWRQMSAMLKLEMENMRGENRLEVAGLRGEVSRLNSGDRTGAADRRTDASMRNTDVRADTSRANTTDRLASGERNTDVRSNTSMRNTDVNAAARQQGGGGGAPAMIMRRLLEQNPDATVEDMQNALKGAKGPSATEIKLDDKGKQFKSAVDTIDSALSDISTGYKRGTPVTGALGSALRIGEVAGNLTGWSDETLAHNFETKIRLLQQQIPGLLTGKTITNKDERARVDVIVRGLTSGATQQITVSDLQLIKKILQDRAPSPSSSARERGGGSRPAQLNPMTPQATELMNKALSEGHPRAAVEKKLRDLGYDPASTPAPAQ